MPISIYKLKRKGRLIKIEKKIFWYSVEVVKHDYNADGTVANFTIDQFHH